jgi:hydrogenase maturation protease
MRGRTLILGLGNPILSDDGFGPMVAERLFDRFSAASGVHVETASVGGFHLLDAIQGYERAILIDIAVTGKHPPGSLRFWGAEERGDPWTLGGSHQMDLATVLELGSRLGFPMPQEIAVLVAEAQEVETIGTELTPALLDAIPSAVRMVQEWTEGVADGRAGGAVVSAMQHEGGMTT